LETRIKDLRVAGLSEGIDHTLHHRRVVLRIGYERRRAPELAVVVEVFIAALDGTEDTTLIRCGAGLFTKAWER
jgi:hypothetical protein